MNETTEAHKAQFAAHMEYWQRELNLFDWRIVPGAKPARGAMADMSIQVADRLAVWRLGKSFGAEMVTDESLSATAFHEACHVLLADLVSALESKAAPELVEAAEHRVINTFERLAMKSQSATTSND